MEGKSEVEDSAARVSTAMAEEYKARIEAQRKELTAEKGKELQVKDQDRADELQRASEEGKARALRDAKLAGVLDDRADESASIVKRSQEEERESVEQLKQLQREVKRAEEEARQARQHAHELRQGAAHDATSAQEALSAAEKLMEQARKDRGEASEKRSEISKARLALKAAEGVEQGLAVRAAKFTGRAKLDLLQSGLLKKAAREHSAKARSVRHQVEKRNEALESLKSSERRAESEERQARSRVHRVRERSVILSTVYPSIRPSIHPSIHPPKADNYDSRVSRHVFPSCVEFSTGESVHFVRHFCKDASVMLLTTVCDCRIELDRERAKHALERAEIKAKHAENAYHVAKADAKAREEASD
jgi:hypothetical protein